MALVECRECGASVSSEAKNCPQCGISNPQKGKVSFTAVFAILGSLVFAFAMLSNPTNNSEKSAREAESTKWLNENGDNPTALQERFGTKADAACATGVDDFLRQIAPYDYAWDEDASGWLDFKFNKYSENSVGHGLLTMISTRAKLSNQFGAFEHTTIYCLYDVMKDGVIRYSQHNPIVHTDDFEVKENNKTYIKPNKSVSDNKYNETIVVYNADSAGVDGADMQNDQ